MGQFLSLADRGPVVGARMSSSVPRVIAVSILPTAQTLHCSKFAKERRFGGEAVEVLKRTTERLGGDFLNRDYEH
jgi:hypothetical protein